MALCISLEEEEMGSRGEGKERKGTERAGKERKGKERAGKERKGKPPAIGRNPWEAR